MLIGLYVQLSFVYTRNTYINFIFLNLNLKTTNSNFLFYTNYYYYYSINKIDSTIFA
jgi:hypothetical protein